MTENNSMVGQSLYDMDGNELGTIKEVRGGYLKVNTRLRPDYWLRESAVQFSGGRGVVSADAEHLTTPPFDETDTETTTNRPVRGTVAADFALASDRSAAGTGEHPPATAQHTDSDTESLQLHEERLRVEKEAQQVGAVHVGTRVTEHEETATVPVREERVVIERTPASGQPSEGGELGTGKTIEMPLMKEEVNVRKEAVVSEEVNVRKEVTERQQPVQETVRKEELVTDREEGRLSEGEGSWTSTHGTDEPGHSHRT